MSKGRAAAANLAIALTNLRPGDRVVDIGCGPGVAARLGAERGAIVTGVDPATVMLRVARRADRAKAVTWQQGGAEALPLPDRSQDIAWALSTVHHWPDLEGGLREVGRVLRPAGASCPANGGVKPDATGLASHGWTPEQAERFAELCRSAGFRDVEVSSHDTTRGVLLTVLAHANS